MVVFDLALNSLRIVLLFRVKQWGNGTKFDASDKDDGINLQDWPTVKGMYMPDAIATFMTGGTRCEYMPLGALSVDSKARRICVSWFSMGVYSAVQ